MQDKPVARRPPSFQPPARNARIIKLLATDQPYLLLLKRAVELLRWGALAIVAGAVVTQATRWIDPENSRNAWNLSSLLGIVFSVLQGVGAWKLTSYKPQNNMRSSGHEFTRWLVRVAGVAALVGCVFITVSSRARYPFARTWFSPIGSAAVLIGLFCPIGVLYLLRFVACDIPNRRLASHATWLLWFLPGVELAYLIVNVSVAMFNFLHANAHSRAIRFSPTVADCMDVLLGGARLWFLIFLSQMLRALDNEVSRSEPTRTD